MNYNVSFIFSDNSSRFKVGGAIPFFIDNIENIASTAPDAPRRCPVDDFVDDFTKSDAKQFKGKSKKKKKEMAVAAYLAKQKA